MHNFYHPRPQAAFILQCCFGVIDLVSKPLQGGEFGCPQQFVTQDNHKHIQNMPEVSLQSPEVFANCRQEKSNFILKNQNLNVLCY